MVQLNLLRKPEESGIVVALEVSSEVDVEYGIQVSFTDQILNDNEALSSFFLKKSKINGKTIVDGKRTFEFGISMTKYEEFAKERGEVNPKITCQAIYSQSISASLADLTPNKVIPATILSVVDGVEKAIVEVQLDNDLYKANKAGYQIIVAVSKDGKLDTDQTWGISTSPPTKDGVVKIVVGGSGAERLDTGDYEFTIHVMNHMGTTTMTAQLAISTDPNTVNATDFDTFDVSGPMFSLEYEAKDYSAYTDGIKLYGNITQNDNDNVALDTPFEIADICGATFNVTAPYKFLMPDNQITALKRYGEEGANKFDLELWLSGEDVSGGHQYQGEKTKSSFWLDKKLESPIVTLLSVDWDNGNQTISVVEDGSFNQYAVEYDLSGNKSTGFMDVSGGKSYATKVYSYEDLKPVDGGLRPLSVTVSRNEINNIAVDNASVNKSDSADINYLQAIRRASAPSVQFTDITLESDGSIKFDYIDASANTDLYGELGYNSYGDFMVVDSSTAEIPHEDASRAVISFNANLNSGVKYIMKAYSRFDMSGIYNGVYKTLNEDKNELLSFVESRFDLFTHIPTMELSVRPTGDTNKLSTVRMSGDANANKLSILSVGILTDKHTYVEKRFDICNNAVDSCGNILNPSGLGTDEYDVNDKFVLDFNFEEDVVGIADNGSLLMIGIIDTPDQQDGIEIKQAAGNEIKALSTAIKAYDAEIIVYNTAVDACGGYLDNEEYKVVQDTYDAWTVSGESLEKLLTDTCDNLLSDDATTDGSNKQVEDLYKMKQEKNYSNNAVKETYSSLAQVVSNWSTSFLNAIGNAKTDLQMTVLSYNIYTPSGEGMYATATDISLPNGGYTLNYMAGVESTTSQLSINSKKAYDESVKAYEDAEKANNNLKSLVTLLNNTENTVGSILWNAKETGDAFAALGAVIAAFGTAVTDSRNRLVGADGTVNEPKDDSLVEKMNSARKVLSVALNGIDDFDIPALKIYNNQQ